METKLIEHKILLTCARTKLRPEAKNELSSLLSQSPDWNYLYQQARLHRLAPLLFFHLREQRIPPAIREILEKSYTFTALHNMLYLEELDKILAQDIPAIVLKGPQLAQKIYGNIALRPFIDLDLLVAEKDIDRLHQLLETMGYQTTNKEFYRQYHFHLPYSRRAKINLHLEIHWAFIDRFILNRIDMRKVFSLIRGKELPAELNAIYLILHLEKHAFLNKAFYDSGNPQEWLFTTPRGNQLLWFTDIYELISHNKINWPEVLNLAREWAISRILYYNLYILDKLYPDLALENVYANLPAIKMSRSKKLFYFAIRRQIKQAGINPEMQLRPIRIADLVDYLFPAPQTLADYYSLKKRFFVILVYPFHLLQALKEILREFIGICKLSIKRKMGYRPAS